MELAKELLTQVGGLSGFLQIQRQQFQQIKGLGDSKYVLFKAAIELAWRLHEEFALIGIHPTLGSVYQYFIPKVREMDNEVLVALFLDKQRNPVAMKSLMLDEMDDSVLHNGTLLLEKILYQASQYKTTAFMLVHYYPFEDGCPMYLDVSIAQMIIREFTNMDCRMLDYVVIGKHHHAPLANKGLW